MTTPFRSEQPSVHVVPSKFSRREFSLGLAAVGLAAVSGVRVGASDRKARVGVIGHTGKGDYGHGLHTMWLNLPETEIVAVADPNEKGLAACLEKVKVSLGFADYREMLKKAQPEIVAVGLGHIDQHCEVALAAIDAGARGIYMEKPYCRTPAEADLILAACKKRNVKLAIAHRNRYHPTLQVVQNLVKAGEIGQLLELRGRGKEDARGGSLDLWILGSHVLNVGSFFAGKPVSCSAVVLQNKRLLSKSDLSEGGNGVGLLGGNEVHARFEMENGLPLYFDSIQNAGDSKVGFGLQLVGTKGVIDLRMDKDPIAHLMPGSPFNPLQEARGWTAISSGGVGKAEQIPNCGKDVIGHLTGARDLLAAIRENRQPLCGPEEGRVIVEMISAVFESHRRGGQRVAFPLEQRSNPLTALS